MHPPDGTVATKTTHDQDRLRPHRLPDPFSFVLGLGLIGIVVGRRNRALHDVAAPSVVCCDWGGRPAEMPAPIARFPSRRAAGSTPEA